MRHTDCLFLLVLALSAQVVLSRPTYNREECSQESGIDSASDNQTKCNLALEWRTCLMIPRHASKRGHFLQLQSMSVAIYTFCNRLSGDLALTSAKPNEDCITFVDECSNYLFLIQSSWLFKNKCIFIREWEECLRHVFWYCNLNDFDSSVTLSAVTTWSLSCSDYMYNGAPDGDDYHDYVDDDGDDDVATYAPDIDTGATTFATNAPFVDTDAPLDTEAPWVATDAPFVDSYYPIFYTDTPFVATDAPFVDAEAPFVDTDAPFLDTEAPFVDSDAPFVDSYYPIFYTDAPFVDTDAPFVATDAPFVDTDAPFVATDAPFVDTDAPFVATDAPFVDTDAPFVDTDAPFV
ncbi:hypothetical protein EGW08_014790, partial [Elysia chlorotica]